MKLEAYVFFYGSTYDVFRYAGSFVEVPWGGKFGMVNDKYGVSWMITAAHG
jgi:uncharacterized glyoxalase superfamily protein PhnB